MTLKNNKLRVSNKNSKILMDNNKYYKLFKVTLNDIKVTPSLYNIYRQI